jgi:hypothetical protein
MPIYKGTTPDGSDMEEVGMYVNPRNPNEWSNMPYPKLKEKECNGRHTYLPKNEWSEDYKNIIKTHWICKCGKHLI